MGNSLSQNSQKVEDIRSKFPHTQEIVVFCENLRAIYFFTEEQIRTVFMKTKTHDINVFRQIIEDVEMDYAKFPMDDMTINEYLYQTLMSVEELDEEGKSHEKYQDILNFPDKYFDIDISNILSFDNFGKIEIDDDVIAQKIKEYISRYVEEFYLINVQEDILFLPDESTKTLPKNVKHYLRFSENRGINFYMFKEKSGKLKMAVGVFGGSAGRTNDYLFAKIFKELDANVYTLGISSFLSTK